MAANPDVPIIDGDDARRLRRRLVGELEAEGCADQRVLDAVASVPRHVFTAGHGLAASYANRPLSIGGGQTISQPLVVAWMADAANLDTDANVLEIGTGSGYGAAVLSRLVGSVVSVERLADLAETASWVLGQLGYANVEVHVGDGSLGWPAGAPYDAIVVTAGAPQVPSALVDQLVDGGRLVVPVGVEAAQRLIRVTRHGSHTRTEDLGGVAFVPLVGEQGWSPTRDGELNPDER